MTGNQRFSKTFARLGPLARPTMEASAGDRRWRCGCRLPPCPARPSTEGQTNAAVAALLSYLRKRKPELNYSGSEPLFVGKRRNRREGTFRLSANSLADLFRQIYHRAGIVGASSHSGRRWFMTELACAGVHPRIIQQRAGHSSLATTQRYIEVTPDQERKAARAIRL